MTRPYVPLRLHSPYSLAEGAVVPEKIAAILRSWSVPAAAFADRNTMAGVYSTTAALKKAGVQPITACLCTVSHTGLAGKSDTSEIVLIAQSEDGYQQISRLLSQAHLENRPIDLKELCRPTFSREFLVLTGGARGPVDKALTADAPDRARQRLKSLSSAFPGRLYVELQRQGEVPAHHAQLIDLAAEQGLPCVASHQTWFIDKDYAEAHDALICIQEGVTLDHDDRGHVDPDGYLKSPDEMDALFADIPEALDNTLEIARRCTFLVEEKAPMLPAFPTEAGRSEAQELRAQAEAGLRERLAVIGLEQGQKTPHGHSCEDYFARLDYELGVIENMGFPGYFLIVADFIAWSKANDIPVGPGRGSGAGSVVAWALTITDLDPLRYGLYFERFLNPERVSMPDFDIDFCNERRTEVIDYVRVKYGTERVAQIGTLGKLKARAAVRSVGRVMQIPFPVVDRYVKMIPDNPANPVSLSDAMDMEPLAGELTSADAQIQDAFRIAVKIEGLYRNQSTHAAGVVIGDKPIAEIVPVYRDDHGTMVTAFDMKAVEKAGLVKFDFLGLKTLDIIKGTLEIADRAGDAVTLKDNDTEDAATYEMLRQGDSFGVFQLESPGMRKAMLQIQPRSIEDIIALVALYRPGPMENIPLYAEVNNGETEPSYLHPAMQETLDETNGIIVYQEQVMKLAQDLAGYTLGGADMLRRAMGKKIKAEMDAQREVFQTGASERGIDPEVASQIFDLIAKFANYGFNKSHAAAYAVISYQTAYLRRHHPEAFLAASMNLDRDNVEKIAMALENARRSNILTLSPDINASRALFDIERIDGRMAVRHGLAALRGVGISMARDIIAEREAAGPYDSLSSFISRNKAHINKKLVESMVYAGALDSLHPSGNRRAMIEAIPDLISDAGNRADEVARGQMTMFDMMPAASVDSFPDVEDWTEAERLQKQFKVIGFYLDGHPIEAARSTLDRRFNSRRIADLYDPDIEQPRKISLGGVITETMFKRTAKKDPLLVLTVSDETGIIEIVAFREKVDLVRSRIRKLEGAAARFDLDLSYRDGEVSLFLEDIEPLALEHF